MPSAYLEVCAFTLQSCLIAEQAGAIRVELCDNPIEGGTIPSYGAIKTAREKLSILLYPIIRHVQEITIMMKMSLRSLGKTLLFAKSLNATAFLLVWEE